MIALGSDHAGYEYKELLKKHLDALGKPYQDFGTASPDSVDYPDVGHTVSKSVASGKCLRGILICGTGIGMSIVANKHSGIRAAVCESTASAKLSREHNDANILCLGARITPWETAKEIVDTFLTTPFSGGERHMNRIQKIHSLTGL
ncbi:MAG: ribose 5-phosphate isomerase B [Ignavibacteriae bacterium]|nr:MAG: ribose 5-phosphate isomerase B [Ignavibacteriota bacterium]